MKKYLALILIAGSLLGPMRTLGFSADMALQLSAIIVPSATDAPAVNGTVTNRPSGSRKEGFFKRLSAASATRKARLSGDELSPANRKARNSVTMGIIALGSIGLGLIFPLIGLAAIPLGILAIVKGQEAKKEGATRKNGTTLGIIALSLVLLGILVVGAALGAIAAFG